MLPKSSTNDSVQSWTNPWPLIRRYSPMNHPLFLSLVAFYVIAFIGIGARYVLLRPATSIGIMAILLLLLGVWCLWYLAFSVAPRDSWASPLHARLRAFAQAGSAAPRRHRFGVVCVVLIVIPFTVSVVTGMALAYTRKAYLEQWPDGTLMTELGLKEVTVVPFITALVAIAVFTASTVVLFRMTRRTSEGVHHCLKCGHGRTTDPTKPCTECGGVDCFTLGPFVQFWDWMAGKRE